MIINALCWYLLWIVLLSFLTQTHWTHSYHIFLFYHEKCDTYSPPSNWCLEQLVGKILCNNKSISHKFYCWSLETTTARFENRQWSVILLRTLEYNISSCSQAPFIPKHTHSHTTHSFSFLMSLSLSPSHSLPVSSCKFPA